eukprot:scaffold1024_cov310-Prasinococcus_capsulatus_cf.AAC.2
MQGMGRTRRCTSWSVRRTTRSAYAPPSSASARRGGASGRRAWRRPSPQVLRAARATTRRDGRAPRPAAASLCNGAAAARRMHPSAVHGGLRAALRGRHRLPPVHRLCLAGAGARALAALPPARGRDGTTRVLIAARAQIPCLRQVLEQIPEEELVAKQAALKFMAYAMRYAVRGYTSMDAADLLAFQLWRMRQVRRRPVRSARASHSLSGGVVVCPVAAGRAPEGRVRDERDVHRLPVRPACDGRGPRRREQEIIWAAGAALHGSVCEDGCALPPCCNKRTARY